MSDLVLKPGGGPNIIVGDNAQGKTNILEAIWLFSGLKSFRGAKDTEYIPFGGDIMSLSLQFISNGREQNASIALDGKKKKLLLNDITKNSVSAFSGVFCTVVFSPDHLSLVKQGPEHRRRMMDGFLCQAFPKYAAILDSYYKILQQRNALLKDLQNRSYLLDTLDAWDKNLLDYGSYITAVRSGYIDRLARHAAEIYSGISGGRETLEIYYRNAVNTGREKLDRQQYRVEMQAALLGSRKEDIQSGSTAVGPHRDDVEILLDQNSARSFGSQGQQRSCVLALKLAECDLLEERCGEPPVVMLDDVMSELDRNRRNYLLNHLSGKQIFITCCEDEVFADMQKGSIFRLSAGKILD